jgi:hypothetical protein
MSGSNGSGLNSPAKPGFDADRFAKHLATNVSAKPFGEGACAKHVRLGLFAAEKRLANWPVSAKLWGASLLALGFKPLAPTETIFRKGDIAVMQPPSSDPDGHGHIQGHDGTNWISDFVQRDFWPGPAYRKEKPAFVVYRYPG